MDAKRAIDTNRALAKSRNLMRDHLQAVSFMMENQMPREAITDMYYAMYYIILLLLSEKGYKLDLDEEHWSVIQRFGRVFCLEQLVDPELYFKLRLAYDGEFYEQQDCYDNIDQAAEMRWEELKLFIVAVSKLNILADLKADNWS